MSTLLEEINSPEDLKRCDPYQLPQLADEIRKTIIDFCTSYGGHLGSNLGAIELSIALHYVFASPEDRIIFDVSHQCYTHKILTGRKSAFCNPEEFGSISGFTCRNESPHDHFDLGHTGTSISLANGLALARNCMNQQHRIVAIIGDGSLSSGTAFEGLNCAAQVKGQLLIVCNDNEMAIDENVGGLYTNLAELRATQGSSAHNIFRDLGFDYRYVEHGNTISALLATFNSVKELNHPVVVHIHTKKGLGIQDAGIAGVSEGHDPNNHWCNPSYQRNSVPGAHSTQRNARWVYGSMAMKSLLDRFEQEPALVVISPATASSNGISHEFRQRAGKHFIDVGIAEEHAISLACGIARGGGSPIVATSSTFFQRAYDQIQQEMSLNGSAVTLLEFASGISDTDVTHSGTFDIPLLGNIPELTCLAPTSGKQLLDMFAWASGPARKPVLIRMPGEDVLAYERAAGVVLSTDEAVTQRTAEPSAPSDLPSQSAQSAQSARTLHPWSRYRTVHEGSGVALLGLGNAYPLACDVAHILRKLSASKLSANQSLMLDISDPTIIDPQQYSTLDTATLNRLHQNHQIVVTLEDSQRNGGWGQRISAYYASTAMRVMSVGADMAFTDRVALSELKRRYGMNADSIAAQLCLLATQECNSRGI